MKGNRDEAEKREKGIPEDEGDWRRGHSREERNRMQVAVRHRGEGRKRRVGIFSGMSRGDLKPHVYNVGERTSTHTSQAVSLSSRMESHYRA
jgi:hypothetical protein